MNYEPKSKMQNYKTAGKWKQSWALDGSYVRAMKGKAETFCLVETQC